MLWAIGGGSLTRSFDEIAGEYAYDKIKGMLHSITPFFGIPIAMISSTTLFIFFIIATVNVGAIIIHYYSLRQTLDFAAYVRQLEPFRFKDCIKGINRACSGGSTSSQFIRSIQAHFEGYKEAYQSMKDPAKFDALMALLQAEYKRRFLSKLAYRSSDSSVLTKQALRLDLIKLPTSAPI